MLSISKMMKQAGPAKAGTFLTILAFLTLVSTVRLSASDTNYVSALKAASQKKYSQAIQLLKMQIGEDSSFVDSYLRLADFYHYNHEPEQGLFFFQKAIERDPWNPNLELGIAQLHKHAEDWQNLFEHCKAGLAKGSTQPDLVELLVESALKLKKTQALAKILRNTRKDSTQKNLYHLGYAIWRNEIKNISRARTTILTYLKQKEDFYGYKVLGDIERQTRNFSQANRAYERALRLGSVDGQRIAVLINLGKNYQAASNKPDSANFYYTGALNLARTSAHRKKQLEICKLLLQFYKQLDMYRNLAAAGLEGVEVASDIGERTFLAGFYLDVAFAYEKIDDLERALKFCKLALLAVQDSPDKKVEASAYLAMGRIYFSFNELERALEHLEQSREIARRTGQSSVQHLALLKEADIYKVYGRILEAKTAYRKVLRYAQKMQQHQLTQTCFVKLADLYLSSDSPEMNSVTYYFNLANALARQTFQLQFGARHRWMQGKQALMQNDVEKAETLFQEAIQLGKESGSYLSLVAGQAGLIRTYLAASLPELAAAYSDSALTSLDAFFEHCEQENTTGLFNLGKDLFEPAIAAFSEVGELEQIYRATELYKSLSHNLALNNIKYTIKSAMIDSITWKVDLESKKIDAVWEDLWQVWNKDRSDHLELVTAHKMKIDKLTREKNRRLLAIKQRYPDDYELLYPKAESLPKLKNKLKSLDATFVHYFVGDSATFVTVVQPQGIACRRINVSEKALTKSVKLISPLLGRQEEHSEFPLADLSLYRADLAGYVYELIFAPIRGLIPPESLVIISPDKILKKLPFESLVTNRDELTDNYDYTSARFLVEDIAIAYTPYAKFVGLSVDRGRKSKKTLVAFANSGLHITASSPAKIYSDGKARNDEGDLRKATNPFGRPEVQLFCGESATKSQFVKESPTYQIIHLNLPYTANEKFPLYSKINFTASEQTQCCLETHDLFNQQLSADLIVLDGIKNRNPGTTPDGLLHGFNHAGVPSVLTSLWWTDNTKLLEDFYLNLKLGITKADALRKAKVSYLKEVSRNPMHWAAFVLAGDTQAIVFKSNSKYWIIYITLIGVAIFLTAIVRQILKIKSGEIKSGP